MLKHTSKTFKILLAVSLIGMMLGCEDFEDSENYELSDIDARAVTSLRDTIEIGLGFATGIRWNVHFASTLGYSEQLTSFYDVTTDTAGIETWHFIFNQDMNVNIPILIEFPDGGDTTLFFDTTFTAIDTVTALNDTLDYSNEIDMDRYFSLPYVILHDFHTGLLDTIRSAISETTPTLNDLYAALQAQNSGITLNDTCYNVRIPGAPPESYQLFENSESGHFVMYGLGLVRVNMYQLNGSDLELVEVQNMSISPELIAGYYDVLAPAGGGSAYAEPRVKFRYAWDMTPGTYLVEFEREETATSNTFRTTILLDE